MEVEEKMNIGAVVVTYNPDIALLKEAVNSLANQIDEMLIVDNGSEQIDAICRIVDSVSNLSVHTLNENTGIAHATNVGLNHFMAKEYDYVITCDQDSVFDSDYVSNFIKILESDPDVDNIAAFVPVYYDEVKNEVSPVYVRSKFFYKALPMTYEKIDVSQAIASGMIINLTALRPIGLMDEELFIDWVDTEWCWRANAKGWLIRSYRSLMMRHSLGDATKRLLGKTFAVHSSVRSYYIIRNGLYIALNKKYPDLPFRIILFSKTVILAAVFVLLENAKPNYILSSAWAVYDGVAGNIGKTKRSL